MRHFKVILKKDEGQLILASVIMPFCFDRLLTEKEAELIDALSSADTEKETEGETRQAEASI